ncbi:MAG TPA: hypothetical protein PK152_01725 [Anaerolineales bacterium]|nr:hypothetical protein [Anaerolineales bacterium]HRK87823.1 hypothetical protein [Anaerolineales bacterium]
MTLKTKRNLPLVLLLIGILIFMAVGMGSQIITSYTVTPASVQAWTSNLATSLMMTQ